MSNENKFLDHIVDPLLRAGFDCKKPVDYFNGSSLTINKGKTCFILLSHGDRIIVEDYTTAKGKDYIFNYKSSPKVVAWLAKKASQYEKGGK